MKVFDPNSVYLPTKKIGKNNPKAAEIEADNAARPCRKRLQVYSRRSTAGWTGCPASSKKTDIPMYRRSSGRMTPPRPLWSNTTVIWPHGSGRSMVICSPSRHRLKRRAYERSSGIWRQKPSTGTTHGGSRHDLAAMTMTEDAKTEENTAGGPCGSYIETPCKFAACRALLTHLK